jgi:hypothetical protein
MLTETQFNVIMILFDDEGHAGWQLAEILGMEESNLNPLLKRLEKKKMIFQGLPRKSNRPKKPKGLKKSENVKNPIVLTKREGDYKEFPYYLIKDLNTFGTIMREMIVTNRSYDIGFPYRIIRASNYMRSMRNKFKENFNKLLANLSYELNIIEIRCQVIEKPIKHNIDGLKELHFISPKDGNRPIKDRRVSKKLLEELEVWWILYNIRRCCSKDPINIEEISGLLEEDLLDDYFLGDDIIEGIYEAVKKLPNHEELDFWLYINNAHGVRSNP